MGNPKPFVHSYSARKIYEQCPFRFHEDRVLRKYPFVQTPQAKEGDRIHKVLELGIRDGIPPRKSDRWLGELIDAARARPGTKLVEQKWGLTKSFGPTGYFDNDVYYRYRNDYAAINAGTAVILDWKTGNDRYPDIEQLAEGAVVLMVHYPEVEGVVTALVFTKTGRVVPESYERHQLDALVDRMAAKYAEIDRAIAAGAYPKTPGPLCPWCPIHDCEFWSPPPEKKR